MLSPYRGPIFAEIGNRPGVELLVLTFSEDQVHRKWDMEGLYSATPFPCARLSQSRGPFRVSHRLRAFDPDVVVLGGYDSEELFEALAFCKRYRKKAVLWSGSTSLSSRHKGAVGLVRKAFIRSVDSFVAYGSLAREFLIANGAAPEKIEVGHNTVDIAFFSDRANSFRGSAEYRALRERFGPLSLLFVGRLIESKGFRQLLDALQRLGKTDFSLVVLGDGPLRQEFEVEAKKRHLRVFFEGFKDIGVMPLYYAASDVFVFPTLQDIWGLVVNEAMACGMPIVSSTEAGVSYDLVQNGVNGWVVDPRNPSELCERLATMMTDEALRRRMGSASSRNIAQFTPQALADAILSASSLSGWPYASACFAHGGS